MLLLNQEVSRKLKNPFQRAFAENGKSFQDQRQSFKSVKVSGQSLSISVKVSGLKVPEVSLS